MFNFTDHIVSKDRTKAEKYAIAISLYDRLEAYGFSPTLYANKQNEEPVIVESLGRTFDSNGASIDDKNNYSRLPRKNIFNAASWNGVEKEDLLKCVEHAHKELSAAIDNSLADYLKFSPELPPLQLEGRLLAAKKEGFDIHTLHYHETEKENEKSIVLNGFDINNVGARSGDNILPDGVFFKPNKNTVELAINPVQMAFLLKKEKSIFFETRDDFEHYTHTIPGVLEISEKISELDINYKKSFDETLENFMVSEEPKKTKIGLELNDLLGNWKSGIRELSAQSRKIITNKLKSERVTTLVIDSDHGSFGRNVSSTIALDTRDILHANINSLPKITLEHINEPPKLKDEHNEISTSRLTPGLSARRKP